MITNSLLHQIEIGRLGNSWGYSMGLPKLEGIIDGVSRGVYTLLFSGTGSGKTTLALYSYIYKPIMEHINDENFRVSYFSLEMSAEMLFAKLLSIYIFEKYKIELSTKELLSKKRNYSLSEENYNIVKECTPWLRRIEQLITVYDKSLNAEILYTCLMEELKNNGKFEETSSRKIYTPNNENLTHLVVIDHLSLVRKSKSRSLKEEMDLISSYLVTLRNMCKISPLVIMQANRDSTSMDRRKAGFDNFQISDIKDTGNPSQDAEIIISIFNPYKEKLATCRDYDIKQLKYNFRLITVLKNRYGESDVEDACAFYGKCGLFKEMPRPDAIYDYCKYEDPKWILEESPSNIPDIKVDNIKEEIVKNKKSLNFIL